MGQDEWHCRPCFLRFGAHRWMHARRVLFLSCVLGIVEGGIEKLKRSKGSGLFDSTIAPENAAGPGKSKGQIKGVRTL
jgi:hypothetical protein